MISEVASTLINVWSQPDSKCPRDVTVFHDVAHYKCTRFDQNDFKPVASLHKMILLLYSSKKKKSNARSLLCILSYIKIRMFLLLLSLFSYSKTNTQQLISVASICRPAPRSRSTFQIMKSEEKHLEINDLILCPNHKDRLIS